MIHRFAQRVLMLIALAGAIVGGRCAPGQQAALLPPVPLDAPTAASTGQSELRSIVESDALPPKARLMSLSDFLDSRDLPKTSRVPTQASNRSLPPFQTAGDSRSSSSFADIAIPGMPDSKPSAGASPPIVPPPTVAPQPVGPGSMLAPAAPSLRPADMAAPNNSTNPSGHPPISSQPPNAFPTDGGLLAEPPPLFDPAARLVEYQGFEFLPSTRGPVPYDPMLEALAYRGKFAVPVQRPWLEFWRPFYSPGIYPPASDLLGSTNLLFPHFLVYGDYRTAVGVNRNQQGNARSWAHRLNLDMDLKLTATERIHGFVGPLDNNNQFTRLDFSSNPVEFRTEMDFKPDTLFFEGDVGAILGGVMGVDSRFDLPFTLGLVPLLYQNGIWMEDAVVGAAFAIPARNHPGLGWANYDATFFAALDQITSDAFQGNQSASQAFGTAWFIDAYDGYIEADYAFLRDDEGTGRSYSNAALAFTRRYFSRISNSVRIISNFGQNGPTALRTADGFLVLVENSLISATPNTLVPYANFFYGSGRPQSVPLAAGSGGILRNTGINFETDGLTGFPTLDATGFNSYGVALGVNLLGPNFRDQLVLETALLGAYGNRAERTAPGDQYALGARYQRPLTHAWLMRLDAMYGLLRNSADIAGGRMELRWKF